MRILTTVFVAAAWTVGLLGTLAANGVAQTANTSNQGSAKVKSCVKVFVAKNVPAYSLSYEYEFPGRNTVHVNGLGDIPSKGSFRYLTEESHLEFRDVTTGEILLDLPLAETVIVAAKPPLNEVPGENDFKADFREFVWDSRSPLKERANAVLGKYFHYQPRQDRGLTFMATTFTPLQLQNVPKGVLGQVALLLSFPYDPTSGKYQFRVQALVREGRDLSDEFRPTRDQSIGQAGDHFVDDLVRQMKTEEKAKP